VCRWEILLLRQGRGRTQEGFDENFFDWLAHQIPIKEEYPYAWISFLRDPHMPVPPREEHSKIGNIFFEVINLFIYIYILFM